MTEAIAGLQMCSRGALVLPSRPEQGYQPQLRVLAFLFLCTLWHLWELLPLSHPPEVTLPLPGSTLTSWKLPPQQRGKGQGLLGTCVGRQGPSSSVHSACRCSGDRDGTVWWVQFKSLPHSWMPLITAGQRQNILTKEITQP